MSNEIDTQPLNQAEQTNLNMNNEEINFYEVIADIPWSYFKVGDIIKVYHEQCPVVKEQCDFYDTYPHLFRRLHHKSEQDRMWNEVASLTNGVDVIYFTIHPWLLEQLKSKWVIIEKRITQS